jgi:hypothetical protein
MEHFRWSVHRQNILGDVGGCRLAATEWRVGHTGSDSGLHK